MGTAFSRKGEPVLKQLRKYIALLLAACLVFALAACSKNGSGDEELFSKDIFAMDTYMTVSAYGEHGEEAVAAAVAEIQRLDALLSTGKDDSEVTGLNENGGGKLSEDTNALMAKALEIYETTDHVFDISVYPVMQLWGFTDQNYKVPSAADLKDALKRVDAGALTYDAEAKTVAFDKDGMAVDFGGIAKGYTSALVCDLYRKLGVTSGLVNLGGNVQTVGHKPDGSEWRVGIQDPEDSDGMLGVVETHDKAVITSGGYERFFEEDGVTYHHIIDPATGRPANSGLTSVTIVAEDGTLADGLSTSLFIMGKAKAIDFWQEHFDEFDMVLCCDDGTLVVTEGIRDAFTPSDDDAVVEYVE